MKFLLFSQAQAWFCIVVSIAAMIILGVLAALFNSRHESFTGGINDPAPEAIPGIVSNIVAAVAVYGFFTVFCAAQVVLAKRDSRRGGISL